jgi:dual-specificity kinase
MSTPSTATATHPSHHQAYGYPHHPSYQPNTSYPTSTAAGTRLANPYAISVPSPTTTTLPYTQPPRIPPATTTPSAMTHQSGSSAAPSAGGRRKKPDWTEFYKNGLPKEVIVIDDSPGPEPSNGAAAPHATTSARPPPAAPQPAGKRRRTGIDTAYDLGHYDRPSFSINPQHYGEESSVTSLSTDRTASLHTTAPTSLGSQGSSGASNGVYYEDGSVGNKRKRATRKSTRDEQKRRELETVGDAFLSYVPPPKPPIKAKDVPVPVVRDVSVLSVPFLSCKADKIYAISTPVPRTRSLTTTTAITLSHLTRH